MAVLKTLGKLFIVSVALLSIGCVSQSSLTSCNPFSRKEFSDATGLPYTAFVHLNSTRVLRESCEEKDKLPDGKCPISTEGYSASGAIIYQSTDDQSVAYVLTARHFCDHITQPVDGETISHTFKATDYHGREHRAVPYFTSTVVDACIMVIDGMDDRLQVAYLSPEPPEQGERVYNLAAPHGLFDTGVILTFEGFYSGTRSASMAVYTIPAAPGSSGSPIFRNDGTMVGMIWSVPMRRYYVGPILVEQRLMENIAFSIPYDALKDIIGSVKSMDDVFGISLAPKTSTITSTSTS